MVSMQEQGRPPTLSFLPKEVFFKNANTMEQMRKVADYISDNV